MRSRRPWAALLNAYLPAAKPEKAGDLYAGFYQELLEENCRINYSARGKISGADADYTLSFLYPYMEDATETDYYDERSSVLWLDYKGVSAIFMGDAESDTEELLMRDAKYGFLGSIDVDLQSTEILKVGHHGSNTATSLEFLRYLHVREAVVSCGENNQYGHPTQEVIDNVSAVGANLYRTDLDNTVMIMVKRDGGYGVKFVK